jgi:hypothetical protein
MRQDTDQFAGFPPHGQDLNAAWSVSQPSEPIAEQPRPRRVRPRPHRKYSDPEEMWRWHWCRMRVIMAWTLVLVTCGVTLTAGSVILSEFL